MKRIKQTHELKLDTHFANAVKRGDKCFEIRKNDRGFQQGDTVVFQVVNKEGKAAYPHPEMSPLYGKGYEITYVLNGWGLKEDYVVFGIREIPLVTLDDEDEARDVDDVPVVRCVDCRYFRDEKWHDWDGTCDWWTMYSSFCGFGERRNDAD